MENGKYCIEKPGKKRAKSRQNMAILGIKTWKMENIAENDRKEGIRTRQGFGELIMLLTLDKKIAFFPETITAISISVRTIAAIQF